MSFRATANLVQFVVCPAGVFALFLLAKRYGVVFGLLMCLFMVAVNVWLASLRCPKCTAWLYWQRAFLVYLRRHCQSCGYDLGRKERRG